MGQEEVNEFLKKKPNKWFKSIEISKGIGIGLPSAINSLRKMRKFDEVKCKVSNVDRRNWITYLYQYKKS